MDMLLESTNILAVIIAFSVLIFVHELGHFVAALATGVKVERFMLGFDAWGLGLKKTVRGIQFGVGILPLGGYVKLKGASDLPGEEECTGDPDELMSKGVGARALIFVSGVVMNFLFGVVLLLGAHLYGVPRLPAVIGHVVDDGPADVAGLQEGDRVLAVDGEPVGGFESMARMVAMSGGKPLLFTVERPRPQDEAEVLHKRVMPALNAGAGRKIHQILVTPQMANRVAGLAPNLPAERRRELARRGLTADARIVGLAGPEAELSVGPMEGGRLQEYVRTHPAAEVVLSVTPPEAGEGAAPRQVPLRLDAAGAYDIGLRYEVRVDRVLPESPAARAGLQAGDLITRVDGRPIAQDETLGDLISDAVYSEISVTVRRDGEMVEVQVPPTPMPYHPRLSPESDVYLGILTSAEEPHRVETVLPGGPAEGVLRPGDVIVRVGGAPLGPEQSLAGAVSRAAAGELTVTLRRDSRTTEVQLSPRILPRHGRAMIGIVYSPRGHIAGARPGSIAERLGLGRQDRLQAFRFSPDLAETTIVWRREGVAEPRRETVATPAEVLADPVAAGVSGTWPIRLEAHYVMAQAPSFGAALGMALRDAGRKALTIYQILAKLVGQELSPTTLGGPVMIFQVMYAAADMGLGKLLDIAALISINLAVLNLLPIPVLDGGHLLFLLIEWLKGSRPSPKVQVVAQYAGFVCLLLLMAVVIGFDIYFSSWFQGILP